MRTLIITLALAISGIACAQENESTWWDNYNSQNSKTAVRNKPDWGEFATKIQIHLNVDWMSGAGSKGFSGSVGYGLGVSEDFFNNKNLGFEVGVYGSKSRLDIAMGNDYNTSVSLTYLELQALANPRLFIDNSALELNLGLSLNLGLTGNMSYKSEDLHINPFSADSGKGKALLKSSHVSLLYGMTYRWKHFYIRMLMHQGLSNIANAGSEKAYLWNFDFSLGYIF